MAEKNIDKGNRQRDGAFVLSFAKGDVYEWQKKYIFWLQNSTNNKEIM